MLKIVKKRLNRVHWVLYISDRLRRKMRSAYQCRVVIRSVGECVARYSAGKRRMLLRKKAFTTTDILGSEKSIE